VSEELRALKSIESKLDQILKWTKLSGMQQFRDLLTQNLPDDTSMLIYEYSDGERGTREIATIAGVKSNATVANYWKKWSELGIVEPSSKYRGRFQRVCSLAEVGLTIPPTPKISTIPEDDESTQERK
jgi:hypothetical protein